MKKITIENLSFVHQGSERQALKDVSLTIQEGECVLLCGKSGCGKTTLTRFLNGLIPEYFQGKMSGHCDVFGLECGKNPIEAYVPVVGSVFQNPKTQYFNTNTTTELAFPCENMGMHSDDIRQRIAACARKYKLEKLLDRNIFHLSDSELEIRGLRTNDLTPYRKKLEEKIQKETAPGNPCLTMHQVAIGYQKKHPVSVVEKFELGSGEIIGLMGANGVGKSTLTKTICGLQKPLAGQILWKGKKITPRELISKSFLVMQDVNYQLFSDSVRERPCL